MATATEIRRGLKVSIAQMERELAAMRAAYNALEGQRKATRAASATRHAQGIARKKVKRAASATRSGTPRVSPPRPGT